MKQGAVAQTALITLAVPSLFNDVLCKYCPREFDLLIRKVSPAPLDGVPSGINAAMRMPTPEYAISRVPRFWIAAEPAQ
jgi:hypothetical protein